MLRSDETIASYVGKPEDLNQMGRPLENSRIREPARRDGTGGEAGT